MPLDPTSTGELVTAAWLNNIVDRINAFLISATGGIWTGTVQNVIQSFRGLHIRTHPNALAAPFQVQLMAADEIVMSDGSRLSGWANQIADITAAGAGGLDTGTEQNSTWYEYHAIAKEDGTKALMFHRSKDYANVSQQVTNTAVAEGLRADAAHNRKAQSFIPTTTGPVPFVDVVLIRQGSPTGTMWFTIEADSAGRPSGTALATSDKLDVALFSNTASAWVRFVFRAPTTLGAATYHLVAYGDYTVSGTNFVYWLGNTAGGYATGKAQKFDSGSSSWSDQTTDTDQAFKVYVTRNDTALTMPTGYTKSRKLGQVFNNSAGNFNAFVQHDRFCRSIGPNVTIVSAHTSAFPTLYDVSSFLPPGPLRVFVAMQHATGTSQVVLSGVPDGFSATTLLSGGGARMDVTSDVGIKPPVSIVTETQGFYLYTSSGGAGVYVYLVGFEWVG